MPKKIIMMSIKKLKHSIACGLILLTAITFDSCTKSAEPTGCKESAFSTSDALSQFATILSKAVADNSALREFIRDEALKQFDNDYDVFYPYVKSKEVEDGVTFRELLLKYCSSEEQLASIEESTPKLTILVPDWSWLDAFSVKNWDPSESNVFVGYTESGESHTVFLNGKAIMLEEGEFPEDPTLIIKDNERMVVSAKTKSGDIQYAFKYPEYDGSQRISSKGRDWHEDDIDLGAEIVDNFVPAKDIDQLVIKAYEEFKENKPLNACQRDYIYYGLSKSNPDTGILNTGICERLYRFRLHPSCYGKISDGDKDDKLNDAKTVHGRSNQLSAKKLKELIWSGGVFDLKFDFYVGKSGETVTNTFNPSYAYSCHGSELFDLSKVHRKFKKQTAFAKGVYKYYFEEKNLVSKWFYPIGIQTLPNWDISEVSNKMMISVSEVDASAVITETVSKTFTYSRNFNWKTDIGAEGDIKAIKVKLGFGLGGSKGQGTEEKNQVVVSYNQASDFICNVDLKFQSKILREKTTKEINGQSVSGYIVDPVSAGDVEMTILPMDIR